MSSGRKAVVLSMMFHGMFLCGIYTVGSTFAQPGRPVVIDFTLLDSGGAGPARKEATAKQPTAPEKKRRTEVREKPVEKKMNTSEMQRTAPIVSPKPALEAAGPVPITANPREAPPQKVSTAVSGAEQNQGTTVPIRTASIAPSGAGGSNSGEQARSRYSREHYAFIKDLIEKNLTYPPRARKMGWTGRVVVCFQVLISGRVDRIRIRDSSGYEILDRNVVDTIREVEPFPRPPEWVELSMPIVYRLD